MEIYTLTSLEKIEQDPDVKLPDFGERLTFGYFSSLANAIDYVCNNDPCEIPSIDKNKIKHSTTLTHAKYIIIEKFPEGIQPYAGERYLFEYKNGRYVQVDEPKELNLVSNFAMG